MMGTSYTTPTELPQITIVDKTLFVNTKACNILPQILAVVSDWGSNKPKHQTIYDYLKTTKRVTDEQLAESFGKKFAAKLNRTTVDGLDVSFLCSLIPLMCSGIASSSSGVWKEDDETKIECLLNRASAIWNSIVLDPNGAAVTPSLPDKVLVLSEKLLEVAGEKYSKASKVKDQKKKLKELISNVKKSNPTARQSEAMQYKRYLETEGISEIESKKDGLQTGTAMFAKQKMGFYFPNLMAGKKIISSKNLLDYEERKATQVIFIEAPNGSGKSSLLHCLLTDILNSNKTSSLFKGSGAYQLPLIFSCRKHSCSTLLQLIRQTLSSADRLLRDDHLLMEAISYLTTMFLVDGLDEMNDESKVIFESHILPYLKNNRTATCIITSRPHSVQQYYDQLDEEGITYETFAIQQLETKQLQLEFLNAFCGEKFKTVAEEYRNSALDLQSPLELAAFCYYLESPIMKKKNFANSTHFMRGFVDELKNLAQYVVYKKTINSGDSIPRSALKSVALVSLGCLLNDQLFLTDKECSWLEKRLTEKMKYSKLKAPEILTCFFQSQKEIPTREPGPYEFFHKSQQEIMAAIYISSQIVDKHKTIETIFEETIATLEEGTAAEAEKKKFKISFFSKGRSALNDLKGFFKKNDLVLPSVMYDLNKRWNGYSDRKLLISLLRTVGSGGFWKPDTLCDWRVVDILAPCKFNEEFAAMAADALPHEKDWGCITKVEEVKVTVGLLPHIQPDVMSLRFETPAPTKDLVRLTDFLKRTDYRGSLEIQLIHSKVTFSPCDDVVNQLTGAKCKLRHFEGCLKDCEALATVASLTTSNATLSLGIANPWLHSLYLLQGSFSSLSLLVSYSECDAARSRHHTAATQCKQQGALTITVQDVPEHGRKYTFKMLKFLNVLSVKSLKLQLERCSLTAEELDSLRQNLVMSNILRDPKGWKEYDPREIGSAPDSKGHAVDAMVKSYRIEGHQLPVISQ